MQIIWHGLSCFEIIAQKAKGEHVTILVDPLDEEKTGLRTPRSNADIVVLTNSEYTTTNPKKTGASETAFMIDGPGEYEVKGVYVQGASAAPKDAKKKSETIYAIEAEDMQVGVLGNFAQAELTGEQMEKMSAIDILLCPVGNGSAIDAKEALKVMSQIEPSIVIPANYQIPKQIIKMGSLQEFLKAVGVGSIEAIPKLVIKKKDITPEEAKIIVLTP